MDQKLQNNVLTAPTSSTNIEATKEGYIRGYGSTFGGEPDRAGDVVLPGAFKKSLQRHVKTGERPLMLWMHQMESPIGRWTAIKEDARGLYVEGKLNLETFAGKQAYEHIRGGDLNGLSIGYVTPEGGRKYAGKGAFHLSEVDIFEISVVSVPANPNARISGVKSLGSKSEAIDMLRGCGLSRKAASRFAAGGFQALKQSYDNKQIDELARQIDRAVEQLRT